MDFFKPIDKKLNTDKCSSLKPQETGKSNIPYYLLSLEEQSDEVIIREDYQELVDNSKKIIKENLRKKKK